jgi:hypothetical protein
VVFKPLDANRLAAAHRPDVPLGPRQRQLAHAATRVEHDVNQYMLPASSVGKRLVAEVHKRVVGALCIAIEKPS